MRSWLPFRGFFLFSLLFSAGMLTGCGGGAGGQATPPSGGSQPVPQPTASSAALVAGDDWTTYAHDESRTAVEALQTGISKSTVAKLAVKWQWKSPAGFIASPVVSQGTVYVADDAGYVTALDSNTGAVRWQHFISGGMVLTPTLQDGMLFVGTHDSSSGSATSVFAALDPSTGNTIWQVTVPGGIRSSPIFVNGKVYVGVALGDPPEFCHPGGIYVYDEMTGAPSVVWLTSPQSNPDGGAVWAPLSYDGTRIVTGTGNTCNSWPKTADAIVSLNSQGTLLWADQTGTPWSDDDIGGGTAIVGATGFVTGKDGNLYAVNLSDGTLAWSRPLGAPEGLGGIATPSVKDGIIIASGGWLEEPEKADPPGGILAGVSTSGNILWSRQTQYSVMSYVARTNDVALTPIDYSFDAIDPATGATLWSFPTPAAFESGAAVVQSGIYIGDLAGNLYAFALAETTTAANAANRRLAARRRLVGASMHPTIPKYCKRF